jgi:2-dehydropantoate 2-reductase
MNTHRHILVVGGGSNAGYLLGLLSNKSEHGGFRVTALANEHQASALRQSGLRIEGRDSVLCSTPEVVVDPLDAPDADLIILAARNEDARAALRGFRKAVERGATVLSISVGMPWWLPAANDGLRDGAIDAAAPHGGLLSSIPLSCLVAGITDLACDRPSPGLVRHYCGRRLAIGPASSDAARLSEIQELLSCPRLECSVVSDIQSMLWSRLIDAGAVDPIGILTRRRRGEILSSQSGRTIVIRAMREIERIGLGLGLGPFRNPEDRLTSRAKSGLPKTSLLHEIEQGLDLELDATISGIIEIGCRIGIVTPTLEILRDLAHVNAAAAQSANKKPAG